ncbi:hypothetical protein D3C79_847670 [compost metagenome]
MRLGQVGAALLITEAGIVPAGLGVPGFTLYSPTPVNLKTPAWRDCAGLMRMQETSGSTGAPKLALWRQDRLYREIMHWVDSAGLDAGARYLNIHSMYSRPC